jgi:hypothetical protein
VTGQRSCWNLRAWRRSSIVCRSAKSNGDPHLFYSPPPLPCGAGYHQRTTKKKLPAFQQTMVLSPVYNSLPNFNDVPRRRREFLSPPPLALSEHVYLYYSVSPTSAPSPPFFRGLEISFAIHLGGVSFRAVESCVGLISLSPLPLLVKEDERKSVSLYLLKGSVFFYSSPACLCLPFFLLSYVSRSCVLVSLWESNYIIYSFIFDQKDVNILFT